MALLSENVTTLSSIDDASFIDFLQEKVELTPSQKQEANEKAASVVRCLNKHYYGIDSADKNSTVIGSFGKNTAVRPRCEVDIDIMFVLPDAVRSRYGVREGNKQSQLLQEVKGVLQSAYPNTELRGDGQVVVVHFSSFKVEVVPTFCRRDGRYLICDTKNGGQYEWVDYDSECRALNEADSRSMVKARNLIKILKYWQRESEITLTSFEIESLVLEYINRPLSLSCTSGYGRIIERIIEYILGVTPLRGLTFSSKMRSAPDDIYRMIKGQSSSPSHREVRYWMK